MTIRQCFFCRGLLAVILSAFLAPCHAHSGKARFHAVVDTDGAADDLRTLCMLLGNREVEVLAVTTSEGALLPDSAAVRVRALLDSFYHEGVPVGAGRAVNAPAPAWRAHSGTVDWGDAATATSGAGFPAASALIAETLGEEEEKVVFIALGALTNLYDVLRENPGVPVTVVSANPACPVVVTPALIDSVAAVPNVYARKIAATHRTPPLAKLVGERHLEAWDDLVAVYLFAPELFSIRELNGTVRACELSDKSAAAEVQTRLTAILRGKPDSESRVFYGFPVGGALYAADVVPIIDSAVARHGLSEWRAGVLTNELHGHLGIYATIGVKMGIRAREYFNIGVDDILVTTYAGHKPPVSCMNDGLQVGTGASVGHGLITVAEIDTPRPEARFTFKDKTIRLVLKPRYADRIRRDVKRGIELYGDLTEPYWQYVRALALRYWLDFDRHEIFDMYVGD